MVGRRGCWWVGEGGGGSKKGCGGSVRVVRGRRGVGKGGVRWARMVNGRRGCQVVSEGGERSARGQ